jgi:lysyl-tRNA synthetase class 1
MSNSNKALHWADEAADKVIRERGGSDGKALYTCASGITPSGTVHAGNFREIISVELVARALRDRGEAVRFIYSWDDFDVFRKVPPNMPQQEMLQSRLRYPITEVSDPWGRDESYARHHEVDVESVLPLVGIHPEYIYQAKRYAEGVYADGIRKALAKRDVLQGILDKFRDDEHKIQGQWWPVTVFCGKCRRDTTVIDGWDGAWGISYHCESCGCEAAADFSGADSGVKLLWRVDWPMRWAYEGVDFEPAGKDHHSQGGSFDTSRDVCREVYGVDAPVTFRYDFIGIKGNPGKMSSSKGNLVDLGDLLRVYTPEVVRYLFAGTRPNTEFTISFDLDVIKIYEDYDKTERIALGIEKPKDDAMFARERRIYEFSQVTTVGSGAGVPIQVPFRHICNLVQIHDGDVDAAVAQAAPGGEAWQLDLLRSRAERARYWVDECAPDEFRFSLKPAASAVDPDLSEAERACVRVLRDDVCAHIDAFPDDKACAQAVYAAAEKCAVDGKVLFRAAYRALIGGEQGPRLANFLRIIGRERLMGILSEY